MNDSNQSSPRDDVPRLESLAVTGLTPERSEAPRSDSSYRLQELLSHLYGTGAASMLEKRLERIVRVFGPGPGPGPGPVADAGHEPATTGAVRFSASDQILITYGDSLKSVRQPLSTLKEFADRRLPELFSAIHILPFFPYSSDDGFAVTDYLSVREDLGNWSQVEALAEHFELMFDLVINHCSREHLWFADFVGGRLPGRDYFLAAEPQPALDQVVRPRNSPLLSLVQTYDGPAHLWTTFSEDQIDLNFGNPEVLCRFAEILMSYLRYGARYIRLDAIAFLWKRIGTNCSSLPETHMVVKVLRLLAERSGVPVRLLTETNVPHDENLSYFGSGDEAHLVYQFSLAPLLLYAYLFENGDPLGRWLNTLDPAPVGCTYLNFIASHDGIGLRPLEGLLPSSEVDAMVDRCRDRGAFVTLRTTAAGGERPYEINSSLFSALGEGPAAQRAFIAMHQLLLAFQGIPAIYVHSLFGTRNDREAVERTGRTRSINRSQLELEALEQALDDAGSHSAQIFSGLSTTLRLRRQQSLFDPDVPQSVLHSDERSLLFQRSRGDGDGLLVVASFRSGAAAIPRPAAWAKGTLYDLLADERLDADRPLPMAPFQVRWLIQA